MNNRETQVMIMSKATGEFLFISMSSVLITYCMKDMGHACPLGYLIKILFKHP